MNLAPRVVHLLGTPGIIAAGILMCCLAFYLGAIRPVEKEAAARRDAVRQLNKRASARPAGMDSREDALRRFHGLFPATDHLPAALKNLWVIAAEYRIDLDKGEYRFESAAGLTRYRVTLPMRATYPQVRHFVNFILREMPAVSIDGLRFERKTITDTELDAQIRLTLYFRSVTAPTPPTPP
jgi:hypothetical protein